MIEAKKSYLDTPKWKFKENTLVLCDRTIVFGKQIYQPAPRVSEDLIIRQFWRKIGNVTNGFGNIWVHDCLNCVINITEEHTISND